MDASACLQWHLFVVVGDVPCVGVVDKEARFINVYIHRFYVDMYILVLLLLIWHHLMPSVMCYVS